MDDGPIEMAISLIVPYAAYLFAEDLRASGVLAVVASGLFMSRRSVDFLSPPVRIQLMGAWSALDFMLNGIVFVLIGLQLPYVIAGIHQYSWATLLQYGAIFSGILILLRVGVDVSGCAGRVVDPASLAQAGQRGEARREGGLRGGLDRYAGGGGVGCCDLAA